MSQLTLITCSFTVPLHSHRALLATPQPATLVDPTLRGDEAPVSLRFLTGLTEDELSRFCAVLASTSLLVRLHRSPPRWELMSAAPLMRVSGA